MREKIIPLAWEALDALLEHLDITLAEKQVPTVLRVRAGLAVEWLFEDLMETEDAQRGRIRLTFPAPQNVRLEYRGPNGPIVPAPQALKELAASPALYGIRLTPEEGGCTILIGVK